MMSSTLSEIILSGKHTHLVTHPHGVGQVIRKDHHKIYKFRFSFLVAEEIWEHPDNMLRIVRSRSIAEKFLLTY